MTRDSNVTFKNNFHNIMREDIFHLPKLRSEKDYYSDVKCLFEEYQNRVVGILNGEESAQIKGICDEILKALASYTNGLPYSSYQHFNKVMDTLQEGENGLIISQKTDITSRFDSDHNDPLHLYRVRATAENRTYKRAEIFHTPYRLREKVSTCRYSISGFPSLYLGTSLALCVEESAQTKESLLIASRFKLNRNRTNNGNINIQVIDLGVKPQDFLREMVATRNNSHIRPFADALARQYLIQYPLMAACSYIRKSKRDPFSPEYVIPQLLMQWARERYVTSSPQKQLIGIRYFSCASRKAGELGINYVFPGSGASEDSLANDYCSILADSFKLTKPIIIDKDNLIFWQRDMDQDSKLKTVNE
ncbi:hypothetical protein [uncultured Trichococcus sp.]|uniref:hypothetical protein n=1 Tax=uncultured Trichococcus sp. TaxID=189665 RepID=UPI002A189538|nr:hypothetical protein [uncultured Trichococcus sp.]